jgi:hypothetical protein
MNCRAAACSVVALSEMLCVPDSRVAQKLEYNVLASVDLASAPGVDFTV